MQESEPNWAKVLHAAYESPSGQVRWIDENRWEDGQEPPESEISLHLSDITDLSSKELEKAMDYTRRTGLLRPTNSGTEYFVTQEGFKVAHDRVVSRRQQNLIESQNDASRALATFTVILGAAALVQAAAAVLSAPSPAKRGLALLYIVILAGLWFFRDHWVMVGK